MSRGHVWYQILSYEVYIEFFFPDYSSGSWSSLSLYREKQLKKFTLFFQFCVHAHSCSREVSVRGQQRSIKSKLFSESECVCARRSSWVWLAVAWAVIFFSSFNPLRDATWKTTQTHTHTHKTPLINEQEQEIEIYLNERARTGKVF